MKAADHPIYQFADYKEVQTRILTLRSWNQASDSYTKRKSNGFIIAAAIELNSDYSEYAIQFIRLGKLTGIRHINFDD